MNLMSAVLCSDHGQEGDIEMEDGVVQDMSDGEGSGDQMLSSDDGLYAKSSKQNY